MPPCVLCGGETFDEFDGHFYCGNCGTQSQVSYAMKNLFGRPSLRTDEVVSGSQ